jgi:WD40 repeat protein
MRVITRLLVVFGCLVLLLSAASHRSSSQTELFGYSNYEVVAAHRGEVRALAFDDVGKRLASAGKDGVILLRDIANKQIIKQLPGHSKPINALAFRRDGRYLASASDDKTVRVWDLQTGASRALEHNSKVITLAFNPSGDILATGGEDKQVTLWSVETGRNLGTHLEHKKGVKSVFFIRDESLYSVGEDRRIIEWDVKAKRVLRSWEDHSDAINTVAVANDWLMLGVESLALPKGITRIGDTRPTEAMRKNYVKVYSLATGGLQKDFDFGGSGVLGLSISADYNFLAAIRGNATKNSIVVYDIKRGEQVAIIEPLSKEKMTSLSFSPNGQWFVSGNESGALNIWRIEGLAPTLAKAAQDLRGRKNVITTGRNPLFSFDQITSLAILDLDAIGVEPTIAQSVSEQIRARVAGTPKLRLIERQRIEKVLSEIKFQQTGQTDPVTAARIGKILNISKISFGSLSRLGRSLTITLQLVEVQTAAIDGIRQVVCNNCADEELLETVAILQPALVNTEAPSSNGVAAADSTETLRPQIKVTTPSDGEKTERETITLQGLITDPQGITSLKINLSNGTRGIKLASAPSEELTFKEPLKSYRLDQSVKLAPGSNLLTITARNVAGATEQLTRVVYRGAEEVAIKNRPVGKKWAFIVGISKYQDARIAPLAFAHRDAEAMAAFLKTLEGGGYRPENMVVLTDGQATWERIRTNLLEFAGKPERDDLVMVFLAAHGSLDLNKEESSVYLIAHNTQFDKISSTALSVNEIELALRENLRAQRVIFFADTCHSGAFPEIRTRALNVTADAVNIALNDAIRRSKPGAFILSSALGSEKSWEDEKWGGGHGVFTWYLLEALRGKADVDKDGLVRTEELFKYVHENVRRDTHDKQHPAILSSKYDPQFPLAFSQRK